VFLDPTVEVRYGRVDAAELSSFIVEGNSFRLPLTWARDTESVTSDCSTWGFEFLATTSRRPACA